MGQHSATVSLTDSALTDATGSRARDAGIDMDIVVIGGGYAGLAALIELRSRLPAARLHLVDPDSHHLKVTQLHTTVTRPVDAIRVPFDELAERYDFEHHRALAGRKRGFDVADVAAWADKGELRLGKARLRFDALVIATGGRPPALPGSDETLDLADLRGTGAMPVVDRLAGLGREVAVSVVGGGATGIQFLFELGEALKARRVPAVLRLVDMADRMLEAQPAAFHDYARLRMAAAGYDYLAHTKYLGQENGEIQLEDVESGEVRALASDVALLFPGAAPWPEALEANRFGELVADGVSLPGVYVAGDCSRLDGPGLNAMTAQAAVRKGKHVAMNIARDARGSALLGYTFRELGYVVSLGSLDAVGWMLTRGNVVKGLGAFAIKELIERQYDLFVSGVDTYLV